jgi:predicted transcriptional regulator
MSTSTSTTSVRIPDDLLERFNRLAEAIERTRSFHVIKALEAYIVEQEYLIALLTEATADAGATAVAAGLVRPEDLGRPDPVSAEEYELAQHQGTRWKSSGRRGR